jgi:hypothetical protein
LVELYDTHKQCRDANYDEQHAAHGALYELQRERRCRLRQRLHPVDVDDKVSEAEAGEEDSDEEEKSPALQLHAGLKKLGKVSQGDSVDTPDGREARALLILPFGERPQPFQFDPIRPWPAAINE